jgi:hypothetical protein
MTGHVDLTSAAWRKSTHSNNGGNCVEVARNLPGVVAVRDSTDPAGPALVLDLGQWRALLAASRAGFPR